MLSLLCTSLTYSTCDQVKAYQSALQLTLDSVDGADVYHFVQQRAVSINKLSRSLNTLRALQLDRFLLGVWETEARDRALSWDIVGSKSILRAASESCAIISSAAAKAAADPSTAETIRASSRLQKASSLGTLSLFTHLPDQPFNMCFHQGLARILGLRGFECVPLPEPSERRRTMIIELVAFAIEGFRENLAACKLHAEGSEVLSDIEEDDEEDCS